METVSGSGGDPRTTSSAGTPRTSTSGVPRRSWPAEGLDPVVVMEVFSRAEGILCGIDEAKVLLAHALADEGEDVVVESLSDGDTFSSKEIVMRIRARYRAFGLYETAILGMLAQSTGWANAARECVEAAAPQPVISFGARHVHPHITDALDYAAIVGGCVGASTPAGARLAGPLADGHDAALAGARHRGHGARGGGLRPPRRAGHPAHRARGHLQGRGRGVAARRPRPGRPALRRPPGHAGRAWPRHRRPRERGARPAGPGGLQPRQDHRLGRPDARPHLVLQGRRRAGRLLRRGQLHQWRLAHRLHG